LGLPQVLFGNVERFKAFCDSQLLPLGKPDSTVIEPVLEYVQLNDNDVNPFDGLDSRTQTDKSFAIVIAEESGSGKSVFSCLSAQRCGYIPLYLLLRLKEAGTTNRKDRRDKAIDVSDIYHRKPVAEFVQLHNKLRTILPAQADCGSRSYQSICHIKEQLNYSRNAWARLLLKEALKNVCAQDTNASHWLDGD